MHENRSSQRITVVAKGELRYKNQRLRCRLENISLSGALVTLEDVVRDPIPPKADCVLVLRNGDDSMPVDVAARVVHYGFGLVGLSFCHQDAAAGAMLSAIVDGTDITWQPLPNPA